MSSTFFVNPRTNPELKSLHDILSLHTPRQLQDYFLGMIAILSEYFPIGYSSLLLQDSQKDLLRVEAVYGIERENHTSTCSNRRGTIGKVLESKQPMAIHNINSEPLYEKMVKEGKKVDRIYPPLLCVPLLTDDAAWGIIMINSLYGVRDRFDEDFQFLTLLSAIVSPVIQRYRLKTHPSYLDEILEEKLNEVIHKIDPYVETKANMGVYNDIVSLVEKSLIKSALKKMNGVQTATAQFLGINRNTLRKKIKELRIKIK